MRRQIDASCAGDWRGAGSSDFGNFALAEVCGGDVRDNVVTDQNIDWTASGLVDKSKPHAAAVSNASGLTPPRWL